MKTVLAGLTIIALIAMGTLVFAYGTGWRGGRHMGYGYEGHMMGPGYGGYMYARSGGYDQKFLDETADLRKELHNKEFEYFEEIRNPVTGTGKVTKLEKRFRPFRKSFTKRYPVLHREA
jgi:hypothetical protein